ncbi:vesicle-associated membrane protein 2 isoform X1 [Monodelphis domestica]|uniref:vesicle-associated membrane protein 2 isoform X1 n=1 Tax=Monodelphis domestica TaxID=13616 RepID=UPI0024E245AC|nr:vesicle-associated membrane protein 2 isoform X1 [Monodelphis domestica]
MGPRSLPGATLPLSLLLLFPLPPLPLPPPRHRRLSCSPPGRPHPSCPGVLRELGSAVPKGDVSPGLLLPAPLPPPWPNRPCRLSPVPSSLACRGGVAFAFRAGVGPGLSEPPENWGRGAKNTQGPGCSGAAEPWYGAETKTGHPEPNQPDPPLEMPDISRSTEDPGVSASHACPSRPPKSLWSWQPPPTHSNPPSLRIWGLPSVPRLPGALRGGLLLLLPCLLLPQQEKGALLLPPQTSLATGGCSKPRPRWMRWWISCG